MGFIDKAKSLKENKSVMKYLTNTSWVLGEKILRLTVGLFVTIWVARYLGPEQFGLFNYAQSFAAIFSVIATFGLDSIVIRELVKNPVKRDIILGTAFALKLFGAFLVLCALLVTLTLLSIDIKTKALVLIIASATVFQSFNVIDFYFQSQVLSRFVVFSNALVLLLSSLLKVFLIIKGAPLIAFAYVFFFDSVVLAAGFVFFYHKHVHRLLSWSFNLITVKSLLKDSWPLIFSNMAILLYMKVDQIMIKHMLDDDAVGQYAAAVRLSEAWYFIPMAITASLFPAILNARNRSTVLYSSRLQHLYDLMAWLAILIAIITTFLSEWGVQLLYGEQYSNAASVLTIHIWASVFVFLGVASSKWFIAENLQKYTLYRTIAGGIINILLNYILIPIYGINGAAFATLVSQAVASYFFNATNKKLRVTFILQSKALLFPIRKLKVLF